MISKNEITPNNGGIKLETSALNGLRGLIAVHVMVFHSSVLSNVRINCYGNVSTASQKEIYPLITLALCK